MKRLEFVLIRLRYGLRHPVVRVGVIAVLAMATCALLALLTWWGPMKLEQWKYLDAVESKRKAWLEGKRTVEVSQANRKARITLALLEKKLNSGLNQSQAVQLISKLAARHGVRVLSQSFEAGKKQEGLAALYIDLTLLGGYQGVRDVLAELPNTNGWIEVLEANLASAGNGSTQVKAQLTLAAYRYTRDSHDRGGM